MNRKRTFYEVVVKRPFDFLVALLALIVLSPFILVIAILVRIKLGSPIIFKQLRPGKNEKIFTMYKFRTMTDKKDHDGNLLPDEIRLTKFGKFLRSTSLDELPGIFNIFKGNMSIVGPRPLLVEYLPRYNEEQKNRHLVRPGLTGLAQVSGRNAITWKQKFEYDLKYIEKITFLKDTAIILRTIKKVLFRDDINSQTSATMEYFEGNEE